MITRINNTITFLKNLFIETFLNNTDKVSVVSDTSIMNATAYGVAKISQKALKEVAIVEATLYPDTASGEYLDRAAALYGVSGRKGPLGSSTYVRVRGSEGTIFPATTGTSDPYFTNTNNIVFNIKEETIIGPSGFAYIPVESSLTGSLTNVAPNTILKCINPPTGFIECTNEYQAIGGRDEEDDEVFRIRIKNTFNVLSASTQEYLLQVLQSIDSNILKIIYDGYSTYEGIIIYISTQNGAYYSWEELEELKISLTPYLPLQDQVSGGANIQLKNIDWTIVGGDTGIDFRVDLNVSGTTAIAAVSQNIQIAMSKYLDFRFWKSGQKVVWDNLLRIVKNTDGVNSVPNAYFYPNSDVVVPNNQLPRVKRFVMRDMSGSIIYNTEVLTPIFYSNE